MTKKLLFVPPSEVYELLGYVDKYVKPAHSTGIGERPWESMVGNLLLGTIHLWLAFDDDSNVVGAATTEIIDYPGYRSIHLITTGGDNGFGFEDYHHQLEKFAVEMKASRIQFWGRKGWSRAINRVVGQNNEKYDEVYRVFSMEIKNNANDSTPEPSHEAPKQLGDCASEG